MKVRSLPNQETHPFLLGWESALSSSVARTLHSLPMIRQPQRPSPLYNLLKSPPTLCRLKQTTKRFVASQTFDEKPAGRDNLNINEKVYNKIASLLDASEYDDGSYAPVLIRLAWHSSGTYDKDLKNGGR